MCLFDLWLLASGGHKTKFLTKKAKGFAHLKVNVDEAQGVNYPLKAFCNCCWKGYYCQCCHRISFGQTRVATVRACSNM